MKRLWKTSLGLTLGLLAANARAGEPQLPVAATSTSAVVQETAAVSIGTPLAALGRPVPRVVEAVAPASPPPTILDPSLQKASFSDMVLAPMTIARSDSGDGPRPMPTGPAKKEDAVEQKGPKLVPEPTPATVTMESVEPTLPAVSGYLDQGHGSDCCTGCGHQGWFGRWIGIGDGCGCDNSRFYIDAEYLLWKMKGAHLPPLVTTGSVNDVVPGALGQPNTAVLFGGGTYDAQPRSGARFTAGYWFDDDHWLGLEGSFSFLANRSVNFAAGSGGTPFLGRPFFDVTNNPSNPGPPFENSQIIALSQVLGGTATVNLSNQFYSAETNLKTNLCCGSWYNVDLLGGFRFLSLEEKLGIGENLQALQSLDFPVVANFPSLQSGTQFGVHDQFNANNHFYGGQIGLHTDLNWGAWGLGVTTKVGLGSTQQTVGISGSTLVSVPGTAPQLYPGGLLAVGTNSGHFSRNMFSVVPELGLKVHYQLTDSIRVFVGYDFLYWSNVVRSGDQIDRTVNTNLLPPAQATSGPLRPAFAFHGSDFYAHGVNFGMEFRY
jgi:hypothetical protein